MTVSVGGAQRAPTFRPNRVERSLRLLSEASAALTTSLDPATTIDRVVRVIVPALADRCVVDLVAAATRRAAISPRSPLQCD